MSINRALLRMAVVSALNNHNQEPWPTMAGGNVFDSKIEPVEDMKTDRAFPAAVVYTDYDKNPWNYGAATHTDRVMTVTIELLIVQAKPVAGGAGGEAEYKISCPTADSEIETALDVLEAQVFRALVAGTPASDLIAYLAPTYENVVSRRGASVEGGQRLAARQITIEFKAARDFVLVSVPPQIDAFLTALADDDDYRERAAEIREFLMELDGLSEAERGRRAIGFGTFNWHRLGMPSAGGVLPPNITFNPTP